MHTDEFEISLSRELNVCKNSILRIRKTLTMMERKHHKTTETFIREYRSGSLTAVPADGGDYPAWETSYASLEQWLDLERQYEEALRMMKI